MAPQYSITFAQSALDDLQDVLDYYRQLQAPRIGEQLVAKIITDIELLTDQPDMGRMVPEFELDYLRELIRPPFRIVYRRDQNKIRIVRVWRSEGLLRMPE